MPVKKINNLQSQAQFSLFVTSYLPLFILIIFKQFYTNFDNLNWGGISFKSINYFLENFGLSTILIIIGTYGYIGAILTFKNIEKASTNGFPSKIIDVKNKNSEAISYIATYIFPFAFQKFDSWFELISILFIILIIYRIYINSSLLLINPIMNLKYAIYDFEFEENGKNKNGMIITTNKFLQEEDNVKLYQIGNKMYYSKNIAQ